MSRETVRRLLSYQPEPEARPHRIRTATAQRLLALNIKTEDGSPRRLVAADATRKRIDALTAAGHSLAELARAIGMPPTSLRRSLSRRSVTAQTAVSVKALYEDLRKSGPRRQLHPDPPKQIAVSSGSIPPSTQTLPGRVMTEARSTLNRPPGNCVSLSKRVATYKIPARSPDGVSEIEGLARRVVSVSETRRGRISPMTGRPHKGARRVIMTRPAQPVADVVLREAAAAGMTISDYVAGILARAVGLPQYVPVPAAQDQQELPLKTA